MPQASSYAWPVGATRALVVAFAAALLFTASAGVAAPTAEARASDQVSTVRRSQVYSESLMLKQDRIIANLKRQRKLTARKLKQARTIAKRSRRGHVTAVRIVRVRSARLARAEARYADATEAPRPAKWRAKMRRLRTDLRVAVRRRQAFGRKVRLATRARKARFRKLISLKRQRRVAVSRQRAAEGSLAARINQMTRLAQQRTSGLASAPLGPNNSTFVWPAVGTITQPFGCTGLRSNSRRGSCRYFHRGIDLVASYGSAVRSAAVGVVAYVGFNPYDERGRAFIVVVAHPNGYITRYGHLVASRVVRAGQVVRKGQRIGKMGNTGFSTGTHVHMEILKGSTPLDPLAFLPEGVVTVRKTAGTSGKSKAAKRKAAKRKAARSKATNRRKTAAARRAKSVRADRASARAAKAALAEDPSVSCPPSTEQIATVDVAAADAQILEFLAAGVQQDGPDTDATCEVDETTEDTSVPAIVAAVATAVDVAGFPIPFRGTSAVPQ